MFNKCKADDPALSLSIEGLSGGWGTSLRTLLRSTSWIEGSDSMKIDWWRKPEMVRSLAVLGMKSCLLRATSLCRGQLSGGDSNTQGSQDSRLGRMEMALRTTADNCHDRLFSVVWSYWYLCEKRKNKSLEDSKNNRRRCGCGWAATLKQALASHPWWRSWQRSWVSLAQATGAVGMRREVWRRSRC